MSSDAQNLDSLASRILQSIIPFLRSSERFNVSNEDNAERIEGASVLLQSFVHACRNFEERKGPESQDNWIHIAGTARECAAAVITSWAELCSPQMNDGSMGDQEKNLVARIDEKINGLQRAVDGLEASLKLGLMRFVNS